MGTNKRQPSIIVVTYNRLESLDRLLGSLKLTDYTNYNDINLIISIDGGGDDKVGELADQFSWEYGTKKVIKHPMNLGLRKHILSCGDLTEQYGDVIILEDDCFVSHNFYHFASQGIEYYGSDDRIAGLSLYSHRFNENAGMPFIPLNDGEDVFFMQVPTSLGQVWTRNHWVRFKEFYDKNPVISKNDDLPQNVISWPESSWKKYFYKYIVEKNLFFVYPSISFLTNFGDIGTHYRYHTQVHQVPIETGLRKITYSFIHFEQSNQKYDGFFELLPECFSAYGVEIDPDCCIDLYGTKDFKRLNNLYALSVKNCKTRIRSWGASAHPLALNPIYKLSGEIISYAKKDEFESLTFLIRQILINNVQPLGFNMGMTSIQSARYYKTGYYLFNPLKIVGFIKRKFQHSI